MLLHRYPFLRLLLPLALGVYLGDELFFRGVELSVQYSLWGLFTLFLLLIASGLLKRYTLRWVFGAMLFLFILLGGFSLMNIQLQQTAIEFPTEETIHRVRIVDKPETKERSIRCAVESSGKNLLLYLAKDSLSERLKNGDDLLVSVRFTCPTRSSNPDEFDYPRYLARKQVSGVGFCASGAWMFLVHRESLSLQEQALAWRERVLDLYRKLGFQGDELAVLSALTVGCKEELSEEIRESYSISGASHVLALSGLHIGFLYALLLFAMRILPNRWRGVVLLRASIVLVLLWAFAFFTGLSPSVVRSVLMCSLFALSGAFGRESFSINTLAAAAFFMLLCCPAWLFDVGFQLSFFAVAAILVVQPGVYRLISVRNRFVKPVWNLISVSLAAQLGTAPLVLLYFSRFSTHFLLTNLIVILLVSLIMYGAVVVLLLTPFTLLQSGAVWVVKGLLQGLNATVRWVEQLPWASFDEVWIYPLEVVLFYLAIGLLLFYRFSHNNKGLIGSLLCFLLLFTFHVSKQVEDRPSQSLTFYQVQGCPVVHCMAVDGRSWLAYADSLPDEKPLRSAVSRQWKRYRLETLQIVTSDYQDSVFCFRDHILSFSGRRVCIVSDNRWAQQSAAQPLAVDYLYVCKGYSGRLEKLSGLFSFSTVVLDASLSPYRLALFKQECREQGYQHISLAEKGSVRFLL